MVNWDRPDNRGSPITAYIIKIRESDDVTFTTATQDCDGTDASIVLNRQCSFAIATLRAAPFSIEWGSNIYAVVIAINSYGESSDSPEGNGAIILTIPDAPINF